MSNRDTLLKILDLARWAPSGDNTQPWRFEIVSDDHIAVHGHDTRDWCLYDFDGHASHMAHGALLETLRIAATGHGLGATWVLRQGSAETAPIYDVRLVRDATLIPDPFLPYIEARVVQRRPMRTTPLTIPQREALAAAPGTGFRMRFFESFDDRFMIGRLLWRNAHIRLTCPEAYRVHSEIIEWGARFSEDRIPEQAVGVDRMTARLMKWVMASWTRVQFFNRYLLGTYAPRLQLDLIPALACGAHVMIVADSAPESLSDYVQAGAAMQRLWLACHSVGLHMQPEMTPVIFGWYERAKRAVSAEASINREVSAVAGDLKRLWEAGSGPDAGPVVLARVGVADAPGSRSLRLPLEKLMHSRTPG